MHRDTSILVYDFVLLHSLTYTLTCFPSAFAAVLRIFGLGLIGCHSPSSLVSTLAGTGGGAGGGVGGAGGTASASRGPFEKCGGRRGERGGLDNTIHIMYVYRDRVLLPSVLATCFLNPSSRPSRHEATFYHIPDYCCVCIPKCGCLTQL